MDLEKYGALLKERLDLGPYATFIPNKQEPVYNWFYYKEGFSKQLADFFLDAFDPKFVVDPFCGSGTTLLACKQRGLDAAGFDVMPVSVLAARVKTQDYNVEELEEMGKHLLKTRFHETRIKFPDIFRRYFSKYVLGDMAVFLEKIQGLPEPSNYFLLMALITASVKSSWAFKDGAVLKVRKQGNIPLRRMLARVMSRMIHDLRNFDAKPCSIEAKQCDARHMELEDNSADAVITSPPYLNNIDYTKVYLIENWFIGEADPLLRSFIGSKSEIEIVYPDMPVSANAYFVDMKLALTEMHRVLKAGGKAAVVVGNAYFSDLDMIVDSDLILASIAEEIGFSVKEILVLNKRYALEKRTIKKGVLRESAIVMEKL